MKQAMILKNVEVLDRNTYARRIVEQTLNRTNRGGLRRHRGQVATVEGFSR